MTGRLFAIGDIHGCDTALGTLLEAISPTREDTVVVLGDVVDRGPGVRQCIDLLIHLKSQCKLVFLEGNHESMMLAAFNSPICGDNWAQFGGRETMESYGDSLDLEIIPESHQQFLQSGQDFFEAQHTIFVHANLNPSLGLNEQTTDWLRWRKLEGKERIFQPGKRVVCGHSSQKSGLPKVFPGWVCIDTFCHGGQWLTALDVLTDTVWQTNEAGQLRGPVPLIQAEKGEW